MPLFISYAFLLRLTFTFITRQKAAEGGTRCVLAVSFGQGQVTDEGNSDLARTPQDTLIDGVGMQSAHLQKVPSGEKGHPLLIELPPTGPDTTEPRTGNEV